MANAVKSRKMLRRLSSEFLSTFFLVFAGTGAIIINEESRGAITHLGIAIAFGLVVTVMIWSFGKYSSHMNPAVTLALAVGKKFPAKEIPVYFSAQFTGAIAASGLLKMLFPANHFLGSTHPAGSDLQSFILEFILTLFLMFTVLSTTKTKNNYAAIAIGSVVLLEALFAGPVCGASMNPFRSLAPALVSGQTQAIWIYLFAPTLGAITAIYVFNFFEK